MGREPDKMMYPRRNIAKYDMFLMNIGLFLLICSMDLLFRGSVHHFIGALGFGLGVGCVEGVVGDGRGTFRAPGMGPMDGDPR